MTDSARTRRSLRTQLVIELTLLLAGALVVPIVVLTRSAVLSSIDRPFWLTLAFAGDVVAFAIAAWLLLRRTLVRPLRELSRAADCLSTPRGLAAAASELEETQELGMAIERMAARVIDDQRDRLRSEKVASTSRLSATVAREIGDALGIMLDNLHLLRKQLLGRAAPSQDLELLATLERESVRLENLAHGLRDYARGKPVTATTVDVEEIIRSSVADLRARGLLETVNVVLELPGAPVHLLATRPDLEQLMTALLVNAVDAMNGRGQIVVRLERAARFTLREPASRRADDGSGDTIEHAPSSRVQRWLATNDAAEIAKIIVADAGPGVPAALAERIFDPFFTTKPPGKGSGLGLAIGARTVENFRGAIWVTTAREGGASFHLLFPIVPATVPARSGKRRLTPAATRRPVPR